MAIAAQAHTSTLVKLNARRGEIAPGTVDVKQHLERHRVGCQRLRIPLCNSSQQVVTIQSKGFSGLADMRFRKGSQRVEPHNVVWFAEMIKQLLQLITGFTAPLRRSTKEPEVKTGFIRFDVAFKFAK